MSDKVVALIGGTFDPIHIGHLQLAQSALALEEIEEVRFIPCYQSVHRTTTITEAQHRVAMIELAIAPIDHCTMSSIELEQKCPRYTIDTLIEIKQQEPNTSFAWVMGADSFFTINQWDRGDELLNYCHILVSERIGTPGTSTISLEEFIKQHYPVNQQVLQNHHSGCIMPLSMTPIDLSATELRQELKEGCYDESKLPKAVVDYIKQHKLYR